MRVRVWTNTLDDAPAAVSSRFGSAVRLPITIDKEYEVMALVQSGSLAVLQIVNDIDFPDWLHSWFFDVIDPTIPDDWVCNTLGDEREIAVGPEFVVKSLESYERMVLLEPDPVDKFWARVRRIEADQQAAMRIVEILRQIAGELEPYTRGPSTDSRGRGSSVREAHVAGESEGQSARAAARWHEKLTTIAITIEAQKSELRSEQRAMWSRAIFDAADSLMNFSLSEQEFPDASKANVRLLELIAALCEVMA